jgi:hypothetical protein
MAAKKLEQCAEYRRNCRRLGDTLCRRMGGNGQKLNYHPLTLKATLTLRALAARGRCPRGKNIFLKRNAVTFDSLGERGEISSFKRKPG